MKDTILLAHYYAPIELQELADHVGDSLDLAQKAKQANAKRIVFAGVKFMAETAKMLNPNAEVILPDEGSTCSLVQQTNMLGLTHWLSLHRANSKKPVQHVAYINSSAEHKRTADWIVTSRNVYDIVEHLQEQGYKVLFSPDRNMGAYLRYENPDWDIEYWHAVCIVHDEFKTQELDLQFRRWTDGPKYLIAHPESPLPVLERANFVGSTREMLDWVKAAPRLERVQQHIYVATEIEMIKIMQRERPDLDIKQAPIYTGCQCNQCPFMKLNTIAAVQRALDSRGGFVIDYLSEEDIRLARKPLYRMLEFQDERAKAA